MAQTGNTATAVWSTNGITSNIYTISQNDKTLDALEDSHLKTLGEKTFTQGDLSDSGEHEFELEWDPVLGLEDAIEKAADTLTITFPLKVAGKTAATLAGTGFFTSQSIPMMKNGELMTAKVKWKWDGKTGPTYTAETT